MEVELSKQEKETAFFLNTRMVIWYLNAFVGCFGGLIVVISAASNAETVGSHMDWNQFLVGMIMILISVIAVFTCRPWTKAEKALYAKLNPDETSK